MSTKQISRDAMLALLQTSTIHPRSPSGGAILAGNAVLALDGVEYEVVAAPAAAEAQAAEPDLGDRVADLFDALRGKTPTAAETATVGAVGAKPPASTAAAPQDLGDLVADAWDRHRGAVALGGLR